MSYITHADLGGQAGYGPVVPEPGEPIFHATWEARALAVTLAAGATGAWNIDMSRAARETLAEYARSGYYEIWIAGLEKLLAQRGMVLGDELSAESALHVAPEVARVLRPQNVAAALAQGSPTQREPTEPARFSVGDAVRAHSEPAAHHTRLPGYARGHRGVVRRVHGAHVFADSHAQGLGEKPQWLYGVAFDAAELWPGEGRAGDQVCIDAWQSYLEAA